MLFSAFGIQEGNAEYDRWVRDSGIRLDDVSDVLASSERFIIVDWRDCLADVLEEVLARQFLSGLDLSVIPNEDGTRARLLRGEQSVDLKYCPADSDDFDDVAIGLNELLGDVVELRSYRPYEGSDGWGYALMPPSEWHSLDSEIPVCCKRLFGDPAQSPNKHDSRARKKWWHFWR